MTFPIEKFQRGLVVALQGSGTLSELLGGNRKIFDRIPEKGGIPPYVAIERIDVEDDGTSCSADEWRVRATVRIFDRDPGAINAAQISDAVHDVMKLPFPVAGFLNNCAILSGAASFTDPDGLTGTGSMSYTYLIESAP